LGLAPGLPLGAELLPAELLPGGGLLVRAEVLPGAELSAGPEVVREAELPLGAELPQADSARARAASTSGVASNPGRPFAEDLRFMPSFDGGTAPD
jgi:hypothetical protein